MDMMIVSQQIGNPDFNASTVSEQLGKSVKTKHLVKGEHYIVRHWGGLPGRNNPYEVVCFQGVGEGSADNYTLFEGNKKVADLAPDEGYFFTVLRDDEQVVLRGINFRQSLCLREDMKSRVTFYAFRAEGEEQQEARALEGEIDAPRAQRKTREAAPVEHVEERVSSAEETLARRDRDAEFWDRLRPEPAKIIEYNDFYVVTKLDEVGRVEVAQQFNGEIEVNDVVIPWKNVYDGIQLRRAVESRGGSWQDVKFRTN